MGCDIHTHAEIRRDGAWEHVGKVFPTDEFERKYSGEQFTDEPFSWRDYQMFERLAGVRAHGLREPLSIPRGLPEDISAETRSAFNDWQPDAHSISWLSLADLLRADLPADDFAGFYEHVKVLQSLGAPDDVRVVFWFDN